MLLAKELRGRFPERWQDREELEAKLIAMHFARVSARHTSAGFDYPEDGSLMS